MSSAMEEVYVDITQGLYTPTKHGLYTYMYTYIGGHHYNMFTLINNILK